MNKRQKKKLYKKICDKYGMPYSRDPRNRLNKTLSKEDSKDISRNLHNLIAITMVYDKVRDFSAAGMNPYAFYNFSEVNDYCRTITIKAGDIIMNSLPIYTEPK